MGIIKKQSIQGTIFLYIGVFIGFVTSLLLFPKILTQEEIGLLSTIVAYSIIFAQLGTLGFNSVIVKMFSYFRNDKNNHNGFFFITLIVIFAGFIITSIFFFILKPYIIEENLKNAPLFVEYINFLLPLIFFTLAFYILDTYYTVLFNAVIGIFIKEFIQRILILFAIIVYYLQYININSFIIAYIVSLSIPTVLIVIRLVYDSEFVVKNNLSFVNKNMQNTMFSVGLFGILTSLVGSINIQVDKIMSTSLLSLEITGIYSIIIVLTGFIKIPARAILKIASAVIAEAWKRNDLEQIKKVYVATSINQYIVALLVFIGLWANVDNVFRILPEYESGKYVILYIGVAYTFEMATGASNNIISTSKHYKYLTYFVAFMLILIVLLNYTLIPIFKINGLAIATSITIIVFNTIKVIFIYKKFKIQPYSLKFVYATFVGIIVYFISYQLPFLNNLIVDIIVRSALISVFFTILMIILKVSPDLNLTIKQIWQKINKFAINTKQDN